METPGVFDKISSLNMRRPGKMGCAFGMVSGIAGGYIPAYQSQVVQTCEAKAPEAMVNCTELGMLLLALFTVAAGAAIEGGIGAYRRKRHINQSVNP